MDEQNRILSREDFLSGNHLKRELVPVPDLGGSVWMRELTAAQMLTIRARVESYKAAGIQDTTPEQSVELMTFLIAMTACDENGALLFTEQDAKQLLDNKPAVIMALGAKALEITGLNDQLISEVAANLKKDQVISSSTASLTNSKKPRRRS